MKQAFATHAIRIAEHGDPEVMQLESVTLPELEPDAVLVRIEAIGVNYIDTYHRSGLYPLALPSGLGVEAAGIVEDSGPEAADLSPGDRVAWTMVIGSYAEHAIVPVARLVRVPEALPLELAAASLLQGMTAHYLTYGVRDTQPGDQALVHAAAGGTGGLLVQMLKGAGARVIATCGSEEKAERVRRLGADEVILYRDEDFAERTRALTEGRGADVVYDSVGRSTFEGSLGSLRPRGLLCLFGQSSGIVPPFPLERLNAAGSLFVTRPSLAHYIADREALELRAAAVFDGLTQRRLEQSIGGRYPLAGAAQAHSDLESRSTTGKLLLVPGEG